MSHAASSALWVQQCSLRDLCAVPVVQSVAALAFLLLFRLRWSVLKTLGVCALVGGIIHIVASRV